MHDHHRRYWHRSWANRRSSTWKTLSPCWTRAAPFPSSPAIGRSSTAPWTTPPCATWRIGCSTCGTWTSGGRRCKSAIEGQGKLTEALAAAIDSAATLAEVEDLYRPYKQKRRTRATVAREKGLEPLAQLLLAQERDCPRPEEAARRASSIRKRAWKRLPTRCREPMTSSPSGSAMMRPSARACGSCWSGGVLCVPSPLRRRTASTACTTSLSSPSAIAGPPDPRHQPGRKRGKAVGHGIAGSGAGAAGAAARRSKARLRGHGICERRRRGRLRPPHLPLPGTGDARGADGQCHEGAIGQFALNLKPLLMQPPVKGKVTMGLDPGYRMGCKVAVVDGTGKVLDTAVVYPTYGERQKKEAIAALAKLIKKHGVENIAIGNGTASRETEQMAVELIRQVNGPARQLYDRLRSRRLRVLRQQAGCRGISPEYDVNLRSAVSIARRLQDPLAELVKIDPKAIGVGSTSTICPRSSWTRLCPAWWRTASTPWAWT